MLSERHKTIVDLALPIMGAMVSQNLMNLVDTAMVGSQGRAALDAVGMSSMAAFMAQAFIMGLSSGVQAMSARRLGEGRAADMAIPLNGGLLMALFIGIPLSVLLYHATPYFYPYLRSDPDVVAVGVPYLRARLVAVTAVGMNFAFRGYFNGVNRSKIYMRSLLVMHACNLVLNYGLIYGKLGMPQLGAVGAGVGTAIATYVATAMYLLMAHRHARRAGFLRGIPDRATMQTMAALSVPSGIQQAFFATGLTALFWIVGQVGTTAGAAANVLITLMLVAILPAMGLGMAAASLVGQALGRGDPDDAERWGWDVVRMAMVALMIIGLPMLLAPRWLLSVFTTDAATIEVGSLPLRIVGGTIFIDAVGMVLQSAMLGAGDSRRVMVVSVALQWGLFLPCAYLVGPLWGMGLLGIWLAQIGQRVLQSGIFAWMWRRRRWADVAM